MENLIYRRQFLLCSKKFALGAFWKESKLSKTPIDCYIYSHQDLEITLAQKDQVELILLGYIIDPYHPERSNQDIVNNLLESQSFDELTANTDPLGGRYAIIYNTQDSINVFHDATGFREVYYYHNDKDFACGSTPSIIAEYFSVERNNEVEINRFFNSPELNNKETFWIGTQTIFNGISKLLPNHFVDLVKNQAYRYWPRQERKIKDLNVAKELFAKILTGTYECATNRYQLDHSITSGWDSRFLMSACRNYINKVQFYFYRGFKGDAGRNGDDYFITKEISEKYNLSTRFIELDEVQVDKEFEKIYFKNNIMARPKLLRAYYYTYVNKLENTFSVSGTMGNEIYRIVSSLNRNTDQAHVIAKTIGYEKYPYIIKSINEWLETTRHLKEKNHILIDLFFWEQYFGNWGALSGAEQDIVRDELRPLNNREMISTFISLPDNARYRHYPKGYIKTIEFLWPELRKINMEIEGYKIKKVLRKFGLEQITEKVYQLIKAHK